MRRFIRRAVPFFLVLLAAVGLAAQARAQQAPLPPPPSAQSSDGTIAPPPDSTDQQMLLKMARERNVLRQKDLVKEAGQLLALAKKLKTEVDKSDKDQLSLSVIDTATQIEKLAKTVRERMRDGD